jgi:hypothetical protein
MDIRIASADRSSLGDGKDFPMKAKARTKPKKVAAARKLPPGITPSSLKLDPRIRKMIEGDRGVASGGLNTIFRPADAGGR